MGVNRWCLAKTLGSDCQIIMKTGKHKQIRTGLGTERKCSGQSDSKGDLPMNKKPSLGTRTEEHLTMQKNYVCSKGVKNRLGSRLGSEVGGKGEC